MNIYKKIKNDFSFLETYDYHYDHIFKHHLYPAVVFLRDNDVAIIGMDYEKEKIYISCFNKIEPKKVSYPLKNIIFDLKNYEGQVAKAKEILLFYLDTKD